MRRVALRRWWEQWWPSVTVILLIAAVVVICLIGSSASGAPLRVVRFAPGRVLLARGTVQSAYAAPGSLDVTLCAGAGGDEDLLRLDPRSGQVLARRALGASADAALESDGTLWLVTSTFTRHASASQLWRLDPRTLAVRSRIPLPASRDADDMSQALAVVGGRLWLAYGDRLAELDPQTGALGLTRTVAKARELGIIAGPGGRTLLVSAGDGSGRGWIQVRSAVTGDFERSTGNYLGVALPVLGGTDAGRLWISEATGMAGDVQVLSLRTLRPVAVWTPPDIATNGIRARALDGMVIVSQDDGGPARNYCGDAVTGRPRATLPWSAQRGAVLAATADRIFYLGPPTRRAPLGPLMTAPIPAACR